MELALEAGEFCMLFYSTIAQKKMFCDLTGEHVAVQ